jgi:hypothetical protein
MNLLATCSRGSPLRITSFYLWSSDIYTSITRSWSGVGSVGFRTWSGLGSRANLGTVMFLGLA